MQSKIISGGINYIYFYYIYSVPKKFAPAGVNQSQLQKNLFQPDFLRWDLICSYWSKFDPAGVNVLRT